MSKREDCVTISTMALVLLTSASVYFSDKDQLISLVVLAMGISQIVSIKALYKFTNKNAIPFHKAMLVMFGFMILVGFTVLILGGLIIYV